MLESDEDEDNTHFALVRKEVNSLQDKIQKIQDEAIVPESSLANYVEYRTCFEVGLARNFCHALLTLMIISRGIRRW